MKPVNVKFIQRIAKGPDVPSVWSEGVLVSFGMDCGDTTGSWSTGIVILPEGNFVNVPVERIVLKDPYKEDDWSS